MNKQVITLELLRHGPTQGQLLSTTTPYLALCGNRGVQGFHVPLDHVEHLGRREGLGYRLNDPVTRGMALQAATRDVSRILAAIPALAAELAVESSDMFHVRLILSAAELAGLPFELAEAPPGAPAEGRSLLLDASRRVVLTREARRVTPTRVPWPQRPRILFVCACPKNLSAVPVDAHLLALRRALDPWIGYVNDPTTEISTHLTVLPNASLAEIERVCRAACNDDIGPFTHVHVLAHGVPLPAEGSRELRFYLALHANGRSMKWDAVDGRRLEEALRPSPVCRDALAVVTVASCDSGNGGSILATGASVAHELHEAGIPFVVASQFPLGFRGSVILAERLYDELLRGEDPILATHVVRRELHALEPSAHDWASMVVYAAMPPDIDAQVAEARYHRTRRSADVALARVTRAQVGPLPGGRAPDRSAYDALDAAVREMEAIVREWPGLAARGHGLLASMAVRWAEHVQMQRVTPDIPSVGQGDGVMPPALTTMGEAEALRRGQQAFERAFAADHGQTWALVQALTLQWARERVLDKEAWAAAEWLCARALRGGDPGQRLSARDNLAQIALMAPLLRVCTEEETRDEMKETRDEVKEHLEALVAATGPRSYFAYTTRRQMRRHATWWSVPRKDETEREGQATVVAVAREMDEWLAKLSVPEMWHER